MMVKGRALFCAALAILGGHDRDLGGQNPCHVRTAQLSEWLLARCTVVQYGAAEALRRAHATSAHITPNAAQDELESEKITEKIARCEFESIHKRQKFKSSS